MYTYQFAALISHNDTLPQRSSYGGYGFCESRYGNVNISTGVAILNCTARSRYYSNYVVTVGRYITLVSTSPSTFTAALSICEVTVIGVQQNISADGNH